ncbi:MAG TPA: hypothetical protein DCO83_05315 [Mucilaginibacter sp.]|nr:hypothetical protein [Mucilaginibacter sp.]
MKKLIAAKPDSFFDFRHVHLSLEEIRHYEDEHRRKINISGVGANETSRGDVRIRFDEKPPY